MPYERVSFRIQKPIPAFSFLMKEFDLDLKEAQRWIDRYRLYQNDINIHEKGLKIVGDVEVVVYNPKPRGLKPIFEEEDFVIYDKPSGILVHPTSRDCEYCLFDEILGNFGKKAHIVHRLDRQTSGLLMVAKNRTAEAKLKMLFEKRKVQKSYLALANGKIEKAMHVEARLKNNNDFTNIKLKMLVSDDGKESITDFEPVEYFEDIDATLVKAYPLTGRQHQIRIHLFHVKHHIVGDTLYGVSVELAKRYLDGEIAEEECKKYFGASRLLLHAQSLAFTYESRDFFIESKKDIKDEFYALAKEKNE